MIDCPKCGNPNDEENKYCTTCASPLNESDSKPPESLTPSYTSSSTATSKEKKYIQPGARKEPVIMAIASFLIPGLGQIFIGQMTKGAVLIVAGIITACVSSGLLYIPIAVFAAWDVYKLSNKLNDGKEIEEFEFFWKKD